MVVWLLAAVLCLCAVMMVPAAAHDDCAEAKYYSGSTDQLSISTAQSSLLSLDEEAFAAPFNQTITRKLTGKGRKVTVRASADSGACPSTETQPAYHGMLRLPKHSVTHKISFRSCINHQNETAIADISGPGAVTQFWLVTGIGQRRQRPKFCVYTSDALTLVVRVYVDGEATPRIEAPLGPMFGIHHDVGDNWGNSNPYGADNNVYKISENGAFTLIAPMPFSKGCRITIQDESPDLTLRMRIWAQTNYAAYDPRCPMPETLRLHAAYRIQDRQVEYPVTNEEPAKYKRSYVVGHGVGRGYLLGATFGFNPQDTLDWWFHNSGELIIMDHQTNPRVYKGTGGEDTFLSSCWFHEHHNFPDWGYQSGDNKNQFSAYRWFVGDMQMPFNSSFQFQYGLNRDFVASVMYWYQSGPAVPMNKHTPLDQRTRKAPVDPTLRIDPPTGQIQHWNFTPIHKLVHWEHSHLEVPVHFDELVGIKPVLGMISVGEYFFRYGVGNEGYPTDVFLWGRAYYQSAVEQEVRIMVTHDDPVELFLNDDLIYSNHKSLPGHHSFDVYTTLDAGRNTFIVKMANNENNNARAFVLGVNLFFGKEAANKDRFYLQPFGGVIDTDFACS